MARKSLVLNGFLGGLNQDGDLSDLESEDRQGNNQLAICEDALCNQPGKIRAKRLSVAAGSGDGLSLSGSESSTTDFLIHGTNYYRQQGVYKLGEDIESSGDSNNQILRPLSLAMGTDVSSSSIKDASVGINTYGSSAGENINYVFYGKAASNNEGNCLIGDSETIYRPRSMLRWAFDKADKIISQYTTFSEWYMMHAFAPSLDATVALWDQDATPSDPGGGIIGWDTVERGAYVATGRDDTQAQVSIVNTDFIRWGRQAGSFNTWDIAMIFRVGNGSYTSAADKPDGLYGDSFNITDKDIYIEIEFNSDDSNVAYDTGTAGQSGTTVTGSGTAWIESMEGEEFVWDDGTNVGVITDVASETSLTVTVAKTQSGGADYSIGTGANIFWTNFQYLNITVDSQGTDAIFHYSTAAYDIFCKTWEISKDELYTYGVTSAGGARFKIPYASAVHTGTNFSSSSVKYIIVTPVCGDQAAPGWAAQKTIWQAKLYELSFTTSDTVGWANTNTSFSQSRIYKSDTTENRVESLIQPYTNFLELVADTSLSINIFEPITADYEGKLYYQEADSTGTPIGSLFLLANISKAKGVKSVLSEFYQQWDSVTVTGAEWTTGNTVEHDLNTQVRVGMRVTSGHAAIVANNFVGAVTDDTHFNLNTAIDGDAASSQTLTLSGRAVLHFSDPPVSSTYQLEAGYPVDTETINALWDHSATVGRQVYIGSVIKTGDDITMELDNQAGAGLTPDMYPKIDTTGYIPLADSVTYTIKITELNSTSPDGFEWRRVIAGGATTDYSGSDTPIVKEGYMGVFTDGLKLRWPTDTGYTVNDRWVITLTKETDLILKSAIGKRFGFPNLQYIDLELPGTGITAMHSVGDRLFVFSSGQLTVVNVAQDYEFLEGTFQGHGVASSKQVVEVNEGLAFVNATGVYYFDGNNMQSLSDDLMMTFNSTNNKWADATNIGYLPEEKLICVWYDYGGGSTGDTIIAYSLATKAWVGVSRSNAPPNTRIKFYNNVPYWLVDGSPDTLTKLTLADTTTNTISIQTGKISCGDLSRYKKFVKVLVTIAKGNEFEIYYKIDSGSWQPSESANSGTPLTDGTSDVSIDQKGKTIQFKIESDTTVEAGTEISDITLVYRDLRID